MPRTKESGIDGIETDPNEIAPMALFGLLIKEQEVETLAKGYMALHQALSDLIQQQDRSVGQPSIRVEKWHRDALEYRP